MKKVYKILFYVLSFVLFVITILEKKLGLNSLTITLVIIPISVIAYYIFPFMNLVGIYFLLLIISLVSVLIDRGNTYSVVLILVYIINAGLLLIRSNQFSETIRRKELDKEKLEEDKNYLLRDINDKEDYNEKALIRLKRYGKLTNIVSKLNEDFTLDEVLDILIEIFKEVIGKGTGYIILEENERFTIKRFFSPEKFELKDVDFDFERGIFNWIQNTRNSVIIKNIKEDYRFKVLDGITGILSCVCSPVISVEHTMGFFKCDSTKEDFFNYDDLNILNILTDVASNVISNAVMYTKVREMATVDNLTGLYLRRFFLERINEEIEKSRDKGFPLSLLMIDIDHFKKVNDTEGHLAGDRVLIEIANLIKLSTREMDISSRYGGEELAIMLPYTDGENADILAGRLREGIENLYIDYMGRTIKVTASIGVASISKDIYTEDELINAADIALYKAKEKGRNKVVRYTKKLKK